MLAKKGVPGVYIASLFGAKTWRRDNPEDLKRWQYRELGGTRYEADHQRAANMERYQESYIKQLLSDGNSRYGKVFERYGSLLRIRRSEPAFHPLANQKVLFLHPSVFAIKRTALDGRSLILALHNMSDSSVEVKLPAGKWKCLLTEDEHMKQLTLKPYEYVWLKKDSLKGIVINASTKQRSIKFPGYNF
jgi:sucrose phosphorylase